MQTVAVLKVKLTWGETLNVLKMTMVEMKYTDGGNYGAVDAFIVVMMELQVQMKWR